MSVEVGTGGRHSEVSSKRCGSLGERRTQQIAVLEKDTNGAADRKTGFCAMQCNVFRRDAGRGPRCRWPYSKWNVCRIDRANRGGDFMRALTWVLLAVA